jgi:GNAT superfamily N-acetyltransferase
MRAARGVVTPPGLGGNRSSTIRGWPIFRRLFADPEWWGSRRARTLHSMAIDAEAEHGYISMRLFTPAGRARARRLYEPEGWRQQDEPRDDAAGLLSAEYGRTIP